MRILVVGGSGFIGRHLVRSLARSNDVTALFRTDSDFLSFARDLGVEALKHDLLTDERTWPQEVCLYLAGNSNHVWSMSQPLEDLEMNLVALNRFLRGFRGDLVFVSSGAVYQGHRGPVSPETPSSPTMPYAISKFASECYVRHYRALGLISSFLIIRLYYAYGPGERKGRLLESLCRRVVLGGERTFRVAGAGDSLMDPLHVDDVVDCLAKSLSSSKPDRVYDLCGGRPRSVRDVVSEVTSDRGVPVEIVGDPARAEVPIEFWSDPAPIRAAFGLEEPRPLKVGVDAYVAWLRESVE